MVRLGCVFGLPLLLACPSFTGLDGAASSSSGERDDPTVDVQTTDEPPPGTPGGASSGTGSTTGQPPGSETTGPDDPDTTGDPDPGTTSSATDGGTSTSGEGTTSDGSSSDGLSSGSESSTGMVVVTCEDLLLPESVPEVCSVSSMDNAEITVLNDCDSITVQLFWVDYVCDEHPYGSAPPGETVSIPSYQTHPWRLRNADTSELMLEIPPLTADTMLGVLSG